jgi:predicted aspartyl protease
VSFQFSAEKGLVVVRAEVFGPLGSMVLRLALDTGATGTMINVAPLVTIGCDPSLSPDRAQVTTGSGVEYVPRVLLNLIKALGQERTQFSVLSHTLPASATIDGLLGLDFLRGQRLTIDFRQADVSLT